MENKLNRNDFFITSLFTIFFCAALEKLVYINEGFKFRRFFVTSLIILSFLLVIRFLSRKHLEDRLNKIYKKIGINKLFIIFSLIIGVFSSVLVPFNEIPDEVTHIKFIYEERGVNLEYKDINDGYYGTPEVMDNNTNKINYNQYFDFSKKINVGPQIGVPKITLIRHLPQAVGTFIGEFLHLPVIMYLALCELLALLFYIFICNKALTLMPFKKKTLMILMLLPICVQQMASFSYDVVLNSFCFLYFATVFNLKFSKENIVGVDILKLFLYIGVIALCKIPYILLVLLMLILPISKLKITLNKKVIDYSVIKSFYSKHKIICWITLVILLFVFALVAYKVLVKISIGRIAISSIINIKSTLLLMKKSVNIFGAYYLETLVGNLGIFNIKTPILFGIFVYFSLFFVSLCDDDESSKKYKLSKFDYIVITTLILIMIYIIILSMFEWTLYVMGVSNYNNLSFADIKLYLNIIPYIGGVQGRYFLPLFPLFFIALKSDKLNKTFSKYSPITYQTIYYILLFVYITYIMLFRFWI